MTPAEYIGLAQRTSSTGEVNPELFERLADPGTLSLLAYAMGKFIVAAQTLDHFKKHIFYGKPFQSEVGLPHHHNYEQIVRAIASPQMVKLIHGIIGKATEAGEMMESLTSIFDGSTPDLVNVAEEMGDDQWYDAEVLTSLGMTYEQIWQMNYEKLYARYGHKFSEDAALNRNLVNERAILESHHNPIEQLAAERLMGEDEN
jgi:hypothetical protein